MSVRWVDGGAIVRVSAATKRRYQILGDDLNEVVVGDVVAFVGTYGECAQFVDDSFSVSDVTDLGVDICPHFDTMSWREAS